MHWAARFRRTKSYPGAKAQVDSDQELLQADGRHEVDPSGKPKHDSVIYPSLRELVANFIFPKHLQVVGFFDKVARF